MPKHWAPAFAGATLLLPAVAQAHGFGRLYNLPVPFWLYAWGAAAVLLVSFLVVGYFASAPAAAAAPSGRDLTHAPWVERLRRGKLIPVLRGLAVIALLLSIATGFFGSRDPYRNFSMTAFWVMFVLVFTYLTALAGDLYQAINPWQTIVRAAERLRAGFTRGRIAYPAWLGEWPALGFYIVFIGIELFGHSRPFSLAELLAAYTLINLAGAWLVGAQAWFRHCEFFAVFLRCVALMAPLDYRPGQGLRWRRPFAGILEQRVGSYGLLAFVLFMLASTAFDGLHMTQSWVFWFWKSPLIESWIGQPPVTAYVRLRPYYVAWEIAWLVAAPFIYLGAYLAFVALAKAIARSERPLRELAFDFGYTMLPIALVYNVTHYFTLILTQGVKIVSLLSDPFGWGWNIFGTAMLFRAPILPDVGLVWHTQVALILLGHIVSVVLAHRIALRVFGSARQATLSQLPMLGLMVLFTVAGLWILAQPLTALTMG